MAKNILKLKETDKATFFSPTNGWSFPAPCTSTSEEREFVVDSGASVHMLSRNDLDPAESETVRISKSPTTVVTANGEVQTKEEATVYVKELNLFGSCFAWKTLRRSRIFLPLDQWSETTSHQKWQEDRLQYGERCTLRCPWSIDRLFKLIFAMTTWNLASLAMNYPGIIVRQHHTDQKQMGFLKEQCAE